MLKDNRYLLDHAKQQPVRVDVKQDECKPRAGAHVRYMLANWPKKGMKNKKKKKNFFLVPTAR